MTRIEELRDQADKLLSDAVQAGYATRNGNAYDGHGPEFCTAWNSAVALHREARKLELAAEPRCELCSRRGNWHVAGVLLCGRHMKQAKKGYAQQTAPLGFLGMMIANYDRRDVLHWAKGETL